MTKNLFLIPVFLIAIQLYSQEKLGNIKINQGEAKRKALVIGNLNYASSIDRLSHTLNDADSMKVALEYLGFTVSLVKDKTYADMAYAVDKFLSSLSANDIAFIYFSGHGSSFQRENYLIPIDFTFECIEDLKYRCIKVENIMGQAHNRRVRNIFVVIDACRDFSPTMRYCSEDDNKSNNTTRSVLVKPENNPSGSLIAFSTDYGNTSTDKSIKNINGLYTESLLEYIRKPYSIRMILDSARIRTKHFSLQLRPNRNAQTPVREDNLDGDFYFLKNNEIEKNRLADSLSNEMRRLEGLMSEKDSTIYKKVDLEPEYLNGGETGLAAFIEANLKYPSREYDEKKRGEVRVRFVVEKNGDLSSITIEKDSKEKSFDEEALRLVKTFDKFEPAKIRGHIVRSENHITINFDKNAAKQYRRGLTFSDKLGVFYERQNGLFFYSIYGFQDAVTNPVKSDMVNLGYMNSTPGWLHGSVNLYLNWISFSLDLLDINRIKIKKSSINNTEIDDLYVMIGKPYGKSRILRTSYPFGMQLATLYVGETIKIPVNKDKDKYITLFGGVSFTKLKKGRFHVASKYDFGNQDQWTRQTFSDKIVGFENKETIYMPQFKLKLSYLVENEYTVSWGVSLVYKYSKINNNFSNDLFQPVSFHSAGFEINL